MANVDQILGWEDEEQGRRLTAGEDQLPQERAKVTRGSGQSSPPMLCRAASAFKLPDLGKKACKNTTETSILHLFDFFLKLWVLTKRAYRSGVVRESQHEVLDRDRAQLPPTHVDRRLACVNFSKG